MDTELMILIGSVAANFILAVLLLIHARKLEASKYLLGIIAGFSGWIVFNYLSDLPLQYGLILWFNRLIFVTSSVIGWAFVLFANVFPDDRSMAKRNKVIMLAVLIIVMVVSASPLLVEEVVPTGGVSEIIFGPGIFLYGIYILGCLIYSLFKIIHNFRKEKDKRKKGILRLLMFGVGMFLFVAVTTNLIMPSVFGVFWLTPIAPLYTSVFIAIIFFSIIKYRFLNVKIIFTESLIFGLWSFLLFQAMMSGSFYLKVTNGVVLLFIVLLGFFLIQSVRKEIAKREEMQRITNQRLRRLNNAKSEFITIASHKLRTPMTAIRGFVSMLLEGAYGKVEGKHKEVLNKIYMSNDRLITLAEDLLNVSQIESGKMEYHYGNIDLEKVTQEVLDTFFIQARERDISTVIIPPQSPLPGVVTDKDKIIYIISSVIDNAIKYTAQGGVTISFSRDNNFVKILVADTGIGISKDETPFLFEKFSRGKGISQMNTEGMGLALHISRNMMKALGGKITFESKGKGKGATFIVHIPLEKLQ